MKFFNFFKKAEQVVEEEGRVIAGKAVYLASMAHKKAKKQAMTATEEVEAAKAKLAEAMTKAANVTRVAHTVAIMAAETARKEAERLLVEAEIATAVADLHANNTVSVSTPMDTSVAPIVVAEPTVVPDIAPIVVAEPTVVPDIAPIVVAEPTVVPDIAPPVVIPVNEPSLAQQLAAANAVNLTNSQ